MQNANGDMKWMEMEKEGFQDWISIIILCLLEGLKFHDIYIGCCVECMR